MITLESLHFTFPGNMIEHRSDQSGKYGWFVCTWHPENNVLLEEIQAEIKLELYHSGIDKVSRFEVESWLKRFFGDFHWKLHALFKKTSLNEKGISVLVGIMYEHEIFIVQFGRLAAAIVGKQGVKVIGANWKNFHVKSLDEMSLLGAMEDDIKVKPVRVTPNEHERLIVLTMKQAQLLLSQVREPEMLKALAESSATDKDTLYLILTAREKQLHPRRRRLKRFQVSGIILIIIALLSTAYMIWGNRFIESGCNKLGIQIRSSRIATLEQVPEFLKNSSPNILKQIFSQPARNIAFKIGWQTALQYEITASPTFSNDNIYLAAHNIVAAYDLRSKKLVWKKQVESVVQGLLMTDGNAGSLLIIEASRHSLAREDSGQIIWQVNHSDRHHSTFRNNPIILANSDDARLDGKITVIPLESGISVYDSNRGELISSITFNDKLLFLSGYDRLRECFYAVVGKTLFCVDLKIRN